METVLPRDQAVVNIVALEDLADALKRDGIPELTLTQKALYLRYYHASQPDGEVYFFTNKGLTDIETRVCGAPTSKAYVYDAFDNTLTEEPERFCSEAGAVYFQMCCGAEG